MNIFQLELIIFFHRTVRPSEGCKDGYLKFSVGEILHVTNTLANYSRTSRNISWQWYAEKVSRNAAGEQGFVPRLERYGFCYRTILFRNLI